MRLPPAAYAQGVVWRDRVPTPRGYPAYLQDTLCFGLVASGKAAGHEPESVDSGERFSNVPYWVDSAVAISAATILSSRIEPLASIIYSLPLRCQ
jgi:hypothetical protein